VKGLTGSTLGVVSQAVYMGFGGLATKPPEDGFLVWASKPSLKAQRDGDGDPRASGSFGAGDTWHDRGACVWRTRRPDGCVVVRW
jgi:hypothetical protein